MKFLEPSSQVGNSDPLGAAQVMKTERLILFLLLQDSLDLETELSQYFSQSEPGHSPLSELLLFSSKADEAPHPLSCTVNTDPAQQNGTGSQCQTDTR